MVQGNFLLSFLMSSFSWFFMTSLEVKSQTKGHSKSTKRACHGNLPNQAAAESDLDQTSENHGSHK